MSADEGYDSEDDRVLERLERARLRRQVHFEAARQMETLRNYRKEQATRRQIKQDAWHANNAVSSTRDCRIEGATETATRNTSVLALHEERWAQVEALASSQEPTELLSFNSIPWPPFDDLGIYLRLLSEADGRHDFRRAYTRTCLRWHPDKFQHRFRRIIVEAEVTTILEKVHEIAQGLNLAWAELRKDMD